MDFIKTVLNVCDRVIPAQWSKNTRDYIQMYLYLEFIIYLSPDIITQVKSRRMRWAGHVARMGEERKVYKVLVGKRPLGRPRRRWEEGIRMDLGRLV
jgi:hypothetical protein